MVKDPLGRHDEDKEPESLPIGVLAPARITVLSIFTPRTVSAESLSFNFIRSLFNNLQIKLKINLAISWPIYTGVAIN